MTLKKILLKARWHFVWWANYFILTLLLSRITSLSSRKLDLERWGSPYGGWYIPYKKLRKRWIYYLVGVGDDISFDLRLVERVGCHVHLFDPTPESAKYMKQFEKNKKIHFHKFGVWQADKKVKFKEPVNSDWTSYSITDLQRTGRTAFTAQCYKLSTIKKRLNHKKIDLLKLDISGAEYEVLDDMFNSNIKPKILLVEFDQPANVFRTYRMIKKILDKGYEVVMRDMWDFTFIQKN